MPNADKILSAVERSNLVTDDVIEQLRKKLARTPAMGLREAVKWLVEKRHITTAQGGRLVASAEKAEDEADAESELNFAASQGDVPVGQTRGAAAAGDDDELDVFPLDADAANDGGKPAAAKPAAAGARWAGTPGNSKSKASTTKEPATRSASRAKAAGARRQAERPKPAPEPAGDAADGPIDDGPLGNGGMGDLFGATGPDSAAMAGNGDALAPAERKAPKPMRKQEDFGSTLMMSLAGALLVVIAVGVGLLYATGRQSADKKFNAAKKLYLAGSLEKAVKEFEEFLHDYPSDSRASEAKVMLAMAKMRMAADGNVRNPVKALEEANTLLSQIAKEERFADAQKELAALLPQIAERLANQAAEQLDATKVEAAREALKLVDKYVPKEIRPNQRISVVVGSLANTEHRIGRGAALAKAVEAMRKAVANGTPQAAYAVRKQLLKDYQDLLADETLNAAVLEVSQAERSSVKYVEQERAAEAADAATPVVAEMVPFDTQGPAAEGVRGEVLFVLAGGAACGIDAETGKALWRRFVGFDTHYVPQSVSNGPGDDALVVDSVHHVVMRVAAKDGELRWRHVVGEEFDADPVLAGGTISVATKSGRLVQIDLASGKSPGYLQLPQGLRVGPAFDARELMCYQVGEHANLFAVTVGTNECKQVFHLGHEPDAIRVPPVVVSPYVFIAENRSSNDARLLIILTDKESGVPVGQAEPLRLAGHVQVPMLVDGRRLVIATDKGAIYSFEIQADDAKPLSEVAGKPAESSAPFVRYPLLNGAELYVGGKGVYKYDIQAARGKLEARWHWDESDTFLQPPRIIGNVAFHVRRKGKAPQVVVSAIRAAGGEKIWETTLQAPVAGVRAPDAAGNLTLMNAAGSLFDVATEKLSRRGAIKAIGTTGDVDASFSAGARPVDFDDGHLALVGGNGEPRARIAEKAPAERLRWLALPDPLGSVPIGFAGGLLVPGRLGQVFLIDPTSGKNLIEPFQPRLKADVDMAWSLPVKINEKELLLADDRKLFRLGISKTGPPRLIKLAEADLAGPVTAIAVVGDSAFAVDRADELRSFQLPELTAGASLALEGGCTWGPLTVGNHVLAATGGGELVALDAERNEVWRTPLTHGPLAGEPLADGDTYLLATLSGFVYRIASETGAELGNVEIGEPLAAGPVALGEKLVLAGYDGTLLVVAGP
jgi:outer membrane protein assembly factor BamB/TolA-binding protein